MSAAACIPSPAAALCGRRRAATTTTASARGTQRLAVSASAPARTGPQLGRVGASCSWEGRLLGAAAAGAVLLGAAGGALANSSAERIAEFPASGLFFKDEVQITSVEDPKVDGVVIYISDFKRKITDRLSKDFFNEPSQASLSCVQYAPIVIKDSNLGKPKEGEEVFSATKNLFQNKTLRVHRTIDEKHGMIIYTSYSTKFVDEDTLSSRFRTSLCAVPLPPPAVAPAV